MEFTAGYSSLINEIRKLREVTIETLKNVTEDEEDSLGHLNQDVSNLHREIGSLYLDSTKMLDNCSVA